MIYTEQNGVIIRDLQAADAPILVKGEIDQGWHATMDKYTMRLAHREKGMCISLVAETGGVPVGYVHVYPDSKWGAFGGNGLPEIVDFAVLEKYRGQGIGALLMDAAEHIAARYADTVYLGVGLHSGYGSAQRMYVKRGYIPDGTGVWYRDQVCAPYAPCENNDSLVLYLSKKLKP